MRLRVCPVGVRPIRQKSPALQSFRARGLVPGPSGRAGYSRPENPGWEGIEEEVCRYQTIVWYVKVILLVAVLRGGGYHGQLEQV